MIPPWPATAGQGARKRPARDSVAPTLPGDTSPTTNAVMWVDTSGLWQARRRIRGHSTPTDECAARLFECRRLRSLSGDGRQAPPAGLGAKKNRVSDRPERAAFCNTR
jgi:hypothetical protein